MSDLTVNIPAVTVTARKPKLTTREDYKNLKIYADAFTRGEVTRDQIPYKYKMHLPETRSDARAIAYKRQKDAERPKLNLDTSTPGDGFIEEVLYNIGSIPGVVNHGTAGFGNIATGVVRTFLGHKPHDNRNLAAFLESPERHGYKRTDDNRGPQFGKALKGKPNVKTYKGVINPYNEYVVYPETYDKFYKMANTGEIYYGNADLENMSCSYDGIGLRERSMAAPLSGSKHRDDVQHYPIQFYVKDGKLFANAADLQDYHGIQG